MSSNLERSASPGIRRLTSVREVGPLLGLIALCALVSILSPVFLTTSNLMNVLVQAAVASILAAGVNFAILTGGIDLSVGSLLGLIGVLIAAVFKSTGSVFLAVATGLVLGFRPRAPQRLHGDGGADPVLHRHLGHHVHRPGPGVRLHAGAAHQLLPRQLPGPGRRGAGRDPHPGHRGVGGLRRGPLRAYPDALRAGDLRHRQQRRGGPALRRERGLVQDRRLRRQRAPRGPGRHHVHRPDQLRPPAGRAAGTSWTPSPRWSSAAPAFPAARAASWAR